MISAKNRAATAGRPTVASGKRINKAAFATPTCPVQGNLGRDAPRGFGATRVDLTLRRQFRLRDRLSLQARANFFSLFNHPNFGGPINYISFSSIRPIDTDAGTFAREAAPIMTPYPRCIGSAAPRSAQLAPKLQV